MPPAHCSCPCHTFKESAPATPCTPAQSQAGSLTAPPLAVNPPPCTASLWPLAHLALPPGPKASAQSFQCFPSDQEGALGGPCPPTMSEPRVTGLLCLSLTERLWALDEPTTNGLPQGSRSPPSLPSLWHWHPRSRSSVAPLTGSPGWAGAQGRALHLGTAAGGPVCHPHQSLKHVSLDLPSIKKRSKLIKDDRDRSAQRLL